MKIIINGEIAQIPTGGGASSSIPSGGIIIWSGAADAVPDGWALCDGTNGTPNLLGRFVLGSNAVHGVGEIGGEEKVTLTVDQMPSHNHDYSRSSSTVEVTKTPGTNTTVRSLLRDSFKTESTGNSNPHNNMPPYYTLAYIMKL